MCHMAARLLTALLLFLPLIGCDSGFQSGSDSADTTQKELLLYCGTAIAPAMREIADIFEQREGCVVKILRGASNSLYHSIQINQVGDLYLPGSESYIEKCAAADMLLMSKKIGVNKAALMVAPGNPLHISADLNNFVAGRYRTVLALAETGAIGKETKRVFTAAGLYEQAIEQANILARDSKDMAAAIVAGRADLAFNWIATGQNKATSAVEVIPLPATVAPPHILRIAVLKTAYYPELARQFVAFVVSPLAQQILHKHRLEE